MIKITRNGDDDDFCNIILQEQLHLFNDSLIDDAISLQEATGDLNKIDSKNDKINDKEDDNKDDDSLLNDVDDEDILSDEDNNKPKKKLTGKETKELIHDTIDKHNDSTKDKKLKKKEVDKQDNNKKDENKYISNNHLISTTRRDGRSTTIDIEQRQQQDKQDEVDMEWRRELNKMRQQPNQSYFF